MTTCGETSSSLKILVQTSDREHSCTVSTKQYRHDARSAAADRVTSRAYDRHVIHETRFGAGQDLQASLRHRDPAKTPGTSERAQRDAALLKKRVARGLPPCAAAAASPWRLFAAVHGVLRCRNCQQTRTGKPFLWHREENAGRNIMAVYLSLADTGQRPAPLTRPARPRGRNYTTQMAGCNGTSLATGTAAGI